MSVINTRFFCNNVQSYGIVGDLHIFLIYYPLHTQTDSQRPANNPHQDPQIRTATYSPKLTTTHTHPPTRAQPRIDACTGARHSSRPSRLNFDRRVRHRPLGLRSLHLSLCCLSDRRVPTAQIMSGRRKDLCGPFPCPVAVPVLLMAPGIRHRAHANSPLKCTNPKENPGLIILYIVCPCVATPPPSPANRLPSLQANLGSDFVRNERGVSSPPRANVV